VGGTVQIWDPQTLTLLGTLTTTAETVTGLAFAGWDMAGIGCLGWQPVCVEPLKITPQLFAARCSVSVQLLSKGMG
jgi:hypothetical protein